MAAVWTRLLLLGVFVAVAHGLMCRRCPIEFLGRCLGSSANVQCDNSTSSCFSSTAGFNVSRTFELQSRGCVMRANCQEETGTFLGVGFTRSVTCCNTEDLCNGGTSVQLSLAAACVAVLASLWAR